MGIPALRSVRRDAHQCCCSSPCSSCPSSPSWYPSMDQPRHGASTHAHHKGPYDVPTANALALKAQSTQKGQRQLLQTLMGISAHRSSRRDAHQGFCSALSVRSAPSVSWLHPIVDASQCAPRPTRRMQRGLPSTAPFMALHAPFKSFMRCRSRRPSPAPMPFSAEHRLHLSPVDRRGGAATDRDRERLPDAAGRRRDVRE